MAWLSASYRLFRLSVTRLNSETYETIEDLYKALDSSEVNMIIVPNIMYLDYTIEKDKYSIKDILLLKMNYRYFILNCMLL